MPTWAIAVIILLVGVAIAAACWIVIGRRRSQHLRGRFGPEYDHVIQENDNPRRADIFRGSEMKFPTESGVLGYRTDGVGGILAPSRVRVLAVVDNEVGTKFGTYVRSAGGDLQGVSPFNPFTITLGDAVSSAEPLQRALAVVAYFDVQTRTASSALTTVGACVPVGNAP